MGNNKEKETPKVDKVYFVATARKCDKYGFEGTRVVGYFLNVEDARKCIEENWGDIYEDGYYKYAFIEGIAPGLYETCLDTEFYEWNGDIKTGKYQKIERPECLKGYCNFTIG